MSSARNHRASNQWSKKMNDLIESALQRFGSLLPGRLSRPGDSRYTAATAIWAKPVEPLPRAVLHCETIGDVQWGVRVAADWDIPLSVRGGGHDWAGRALCGGLVIDLSGMKEVLIDRGMRIARIEGGALASDVAAAADPLGAAVAAGSCSSVGMAGLTLGGGYGALIGRFGLALDNLLAAEVVLSDGRVVIADKDNEAELFWAIRGGGGNFGIVTRMWHRVHDLPSVRTGTLVYPFAEASGILARCAEITATAPDELTVQLGFIVGPDGTPALMVIPNWCGNPEGGETRLLPFLRLGTLLAGSLEAMPYGASLTFFDPYIVNGLRTFMETCWIPTINDSSIDAFIQAMETVVSPGCAIITHEFKGAASRVPVEETVFAFRRSHVFVQILAAFIDRSDRWEEERHRDWAMSTRQAFGAIALPGGYPNVLASSDVDRAAVSYGRNAPRLLKAKRLYDPGNLFRSAIPLPPDENAFRKPSE
jgi:FAD binding domain/Berberine and berberine like